MGTHDRAVAYWAIVVFMFVFGFLGFLSIGLPFLLLGITLAIMRPRPTASSIRPGSHTVVISSIGTWWFAHRIASRHAPPDPIPS